MIDYREILSSSFQQKRRINTRYSLRAFARDIEMSPSRLSEVMAGKGELSKDKAAVIAKKLQLAPMLKEEFFDLIDSVSAPEKKSREAALERIALREKNSQRHTFQDDEFNLVSDPKYFVIWSYMRLPSFNGSIDEMCKSLNLNSLEVFEALKRLERINLVKRQGLHWSALSGNFNIGDSLPSESIRSYHRNIAVLGRKSIDQQHKDMRHLDSAIITFDSKRIGEVQHKIANFTQSLIDEYGSGANVDSIYGWSSQFFSLARPEPNSPSNQQKH